MQTLDTHNTRYYFKGVSCADINFSGFTFEIELGGDQKLVFDTSAFSDAASYGCVFNLNVEYEEDL